MAIPVNDPPVPRDRRQRVQAATTGVAVLKGLASLGGRASLTVLARHIGENPAKVHRYLGTMVDEGLVAQDAVSQQYYLGPEAIHIGLIAMRVADPLRLAEAPLARLCESLGLTCFLAVMGNKGPTIVRFEEPGLPVTVNVRVGSVLTLLTSATGRAFLAYHVDPRLTQLARDEFAQLTDSQHEGESFENYLQVLRQRVRATGLALVQDVYLRGISAIAAPIFDAMGKVGAVLTVLGSTGSFVAEAEGEVAESIRAETLAISRAMGGGDTAG